MNRGQPDNEIKDFDDLYNNLKVYEHELKGVSNSSSPNIAFMSTEVKGSTLKQSTAEPTNIPKGYTQVLPQARPATNIKMLWKKWHLGGRLAMHNCKDREVYEGRQEDQLITAKELNQLLTNQRLNVLNCQK
ncbi:hypothetical protein Tco_0122063 [Tanacetum coccineum]